MARTSSGWRRSATTSTALSRARIEERTMPHVIVKLWPGKSEQQKRRLAAAITKDVASVLNYGDESVSVALEEVAAAEWGEKVYCQDTKCRPATAPRKKKESNHARSSALRSARRAHRRSSGPTHRRPDRRRDPAVGNLHLRLGPLAVSGSQRQQRPGSHG